MVGFSEEEEGGKGGEAALIANLQDERGVSPASKECLGGRYAYG